MERQLSETLNEAMNNIKDLCLKIWCRDYHRGFVVMKRGLAHRKKKKVTYESRECKPG